MEYRALDISRRLIPPLNMSINHNIYILEILENMSGAAMTIYLDCGSARMKVVLRVVQWLQLGEVRYSRDVSVAGCLDLARQTLPKDGRLLVVQLLRKRSFRFKIIGAVSFEHGLIISFLKTRFCFLYAGNNEVRQQRYAKVPIGKQVHVCLEPTYIYIVYNLPVAHWNAIYTWERFCWRDEVG